MELLGRYSNLNHQIARFRQLAQMAPNPRPPSIMSHKQIQHRIGPEAEGKLAEDYLDGATVYQLAESYEINRRTVSVILERQGVARRYQGLSQPEIEQAVELYGEGWSLARIGSVLGVCDSTVLNTLRRAGVRMRDCQGRER